MDDIREKNDEDSNVAEGINTTKTIKATSREVADNKFLENKEMKQARRSVQFNEKIDTKYFSTESHFQRADTYDRYSTYTQQHAKTYNPTQQGKSTQFTVIAKASSSLDDKIQQRGMNMVWYQTRHFGTHR